VVFSAPIFLSIFLPLVLITYLVAARSARNTILLVASITFYVWGAGFATWVLAWVVAASYIGAIYIHRGGSHLTTHIVVVATLGPLIWFKYSAFLSQIFSSGLAIFDVTVGVIPPHVLPVGISFFTFQALSYVLDIRAGNVAPLDRPDRYSLYISLFPQLVAGPIVRYSEIRYQLFHRSTTTTDLGAGAVRFAHGLFKKVVVADTVGQIADAVFESSLPRSTLTAWLGVIAYTLQIYFDFSGYSDMAIGLGRIFGFGFPENFRRPYSAASLTEFWRRWHMTLSNWFRDYVYIPLGGSRRGPVLQYRNLIVVFFLTALWHGAALTFLIWGGIHGFWMIAERILGIRDASRWRGIRRFTTLLVVMTAWVFFRAASVGQAVGYLRSMYTWTQVPPDPAIVAAVTWPAALILLLASATFLLPGTWVTGIVLENLGDSARSTFVRMATICVTLPVALLFVATHQYSPFLYFQF
jgi:alginate O-acetyltransferase complex protein AlgI